MESPLLETLTSRKTQDTDSKTSMVKELGFSRTPFLTEAKKVGVSDPPYHETGRGIHNVLSAYKAYTKDLGFDASPRSCDTVKRVLYEKN